MLSGKHIKTADNVKKNHYFSAEASRCVEDLAFFMVSVHDASVLNKWFCFTFYAVLMS